MMKMTVIACCCGNAVIEQKRLLQAAIAVVPPPVRALALAVAALPDADRARAIGDLYANERLRNVAELLIDLELTPETQAFVVGLLRLVG
ncbi:MAG: hypothetical protein ACRDHU_11865 [Actinomycetota bacterium]